MVLGISSIDTSNKEQFLQKLQAAGVTKEELEQARALGPDAFMQLLKSHGIQPPALPEGKIVGMNRLGDKGKEEFMKKLESAGISKEEFQAAFMQGPEAVRKLLQAHGIQPPNSEDNKVGQCGGHHSLKMGNGGQLMQKLQEAGITREKLETAGVTREEFGSASMNGTLSQMLKQHGIELGNL